MLKINLNKNKLSSNLIIQTIVFTINLLLNFFLKPFITKSLGVESFGFISLANQFINIFNIFIIALNSMSGRYISIAFYKKDFEKVNKYFSSILLTNWVFVLLFFIPSVFIILYLQNFISIHESILTDIKILYLFLFLNYFIGLLFTTHSVSTFIVNKIYLSSLRALEGNIIKIIFIIILFIVFPPFSFFIGIASLLTTIYTSYFNIVYKNKFLPEIKFKLKYFNLISTFEIIKSGFWNVLIRIGQVLINGFDLLISNWFIGPIVMGILALSKTLPSVIISFIGVIVFAFSPDFTYLYALNEIEKLKQSIKRSIKILGLIVNVPIALLIVLGNDFYKLWLPTSPYETINLLSIISLLPLILSGSLNSLYNIFTVTNKLKLNSISVIISGVLSFFFSIILLNFTNLGVYGIAISSSFFSIIRILFITLPFSAIYLGLKWNTFFFDLSKSIISFTITLFFSILFRFILLPSNWHLLFITSLLTFLLSVTLNIFIIFTKSERQLFWSSIK
jgi:O-antigen/teichoic acid export membrane protein